MGGKVFVAKFFRDASWDSGVRARSWRDRARRISILDGLVVAAKDYPAHHSAANVRFLPRSEIPSWQVIPSYAVRVRLNSDEIDSW
jgi:hypothetical protein